MSRRVLRWSIVVATLLLAAVCAGVAMVLPGVAAGGLLYPFRRPVTQAPPQGCEDVTYLGEEVTLKGWACLATGAHRGTLVFLHGVADNRAGAAGVVPRFVGQGFDVVAYDSRAQGESTGEICTYGYREKADLRHVLDTVRPGPIVLLGTSLGAAVALQEAAEDPRVTGVVAAEVFSDLRTVARERAPFFLTEGTIRRAFAIAEDRGHFEIDRVSPVQAALSIHVPVLLIHGADDTDTPPDHSRRVFDALKGPKDLILVEGARHNESLRRQDTWRRIEDWIGRVVHAGG
jgi:pimeloyl-ACP methyl ester carboxylesterase